MNKTEEAYAAHLALQLAAGEIAWFRFESVKLKLAEKTHLTIDFFVMTAAVGSASATFFVRVPSFFHARRTVSATDSRLEMLPSRTESFASGSIA